MAILTGFRSADSTLAQRTWILLWLLSGQGCVILVIVVMEFAYPTEYMMDEGSNIVFGLVATMVVGGAVVTCAVGGFVVVAQMILQDEICIRV